MSESLVLSGKPAIAMRGTGIPVREQVFTRKVAAHARLQWPDKTAAHWAARAGCSERNAKFWLAEPPQRSVSREGLWAVLTAIGERI